MHLHPKQKATEKDSTLRVEMSGGAARAREEQRQMHLQQKQKATEKDSTLRVEMSGWEEQADNAKTRDLYWKPLSWLGTIPTSQRRL
jgi:hypothetical protein